MPCPKPAHRTLPAAAGAGRARHLPIPPGRALHAGAIALQGELPGPTQGHRGVGGPRGTLVPRGTEATAVGVGQGGRDPQPRHVAEQARRTGRGAGGGLEAGGGAVQARRAGRAHAGALVVAVRPRSTGHGRVVGRPGWAVVPCSAGACTGGRVGALGVPEPACSAGAALPRAAQGVRAAGAEECRGGRGALATRVARSARPLTCGVHGQRDPDAEPPCRARTRAVGRAQARLGAEAPRGTHGAHGVPTCCEFAQGARRPTGEWRGGALLRQLSRCTFPTALLHPRALHVPVTASGTGQAHAHASGAVPPAGAQNTHRVHCSRPTRVARVTRPRASRGVCTVLRPVPARGAVPTGPRALLAVLPGTTQDDSGGGGP
jgi:hypothetical protein